MRESVRTPPPSRPRLPRASVLAAAAAAALVSVPARAGILDPAPAYPTRFSDTALMYDWTGLYVSPSYWLRSAGNLISSDNGTAATT